MIFRIAMNSKVSYSELRDMPIGLRDLHQMMLVKYIEEQNEEARRAAGKKTL